MTDGLQVVCREYSSWLESVSPFVRCLVFIPLFFTHQWVCKALRKHVGLQGFIMKLRIKHTRNNPDVPLREFLCGYRIVNSGTCNLVPDKTTLGGGTWHFVEDDGRLFKLISNEFAAWLVSSWFSYFNFSSVCPAFVWLFSCLCLHLCLTLSCFSVLFSRQTLRHVQGWQKYWVC